MFNAFREIGRWLGIGVGNLVNIFNPDLIVFGGFYHPLFPFLEQAINEAASTGGARSALGIVPNLPSQISVSTLG